MDEIVKLIRENLDERHIQFDYKRTEKFHIFSLPYKLHGSKLSRIHVSIVPVPGQYDDFAYWHIVSLSGTDFIADEFHLDQVRELLSYINFGLLAGSFQIDHESRKVFFKVCLHYLNEVPWPEAMLDGLIFTPVREYEKYGDGILRVMLGMASAKQEIAKLSKEERIGEAI